MSVELPRDPDEIGARYIVTSRPQSRASAAISRREAIRRRSSRPKAGAAMASKMAASLLVQQISDNLGREGEEVVLAPRSD